MFGHGEGVAVAGAFDFDNGHGGFHVESDSELSGRARIHAFAGDGRQGIDIGGGVMVAIEFLVIGDLHLLVGVRSDGKDSEVEGAIIGLLE